MSNEPKESFVRLSSASEDPITYEDLSEDDDYYVHKIHKNKYLILNLPQLRPILVNGAGRIYFELALGLETLEECLEILPEARHDNFRKFYSDLLTIDFLDRTRVVPDPMPSPRQPRPKGILFFLHLTHRCNLKCSYCYNAHARGDQTKLPFSDITKILDQILPFTSSITFSGGEPLLHPDFSRVVEYAAARGAQISVITNGMIDLEPLGSSLVRKIHKLSISADRLEGEDPYRHGFDPAKFHKNVEWLLRNDLHSKLTVSSVFTAKNVSEVMKVKAFCDERGIKHTASILHPSKFYRCAETELPDTRNIAGYDFIERDTCFVTEEGSFDPLRSTFIQGRCGAGDNELSIDAHGDVYPCQSLHFPGLSMGNLLRQPLEDILKSEVMDHLEHCGDVKNRAGCCDCKLKYFCGGGCMANVYHLTGHLDAFPGVLCDMRRMMTLELLSRCAFYPAHLEQSITAKQR